MRRLPVAQLPKLLNFGSTAFGTPLYAATLEGWIENAEILLDAGA